MKNDVINRATEGISNALTTTEKQVAKESLLNCKMADELKIKKGFRSMRINLGEGKQQTNLVSPSKFQEKLDNGWVFTN